MGLPDLDSASTWGGKLLVDRDGTEIGTCTQVFVDDATGLPEWAEADLSGGPGVLPLMDAAESGDRVRVAVLRADVADAPRVDDPGHISQDEEERLYRHYGIQFSSEASESLLPVDEPIAPETVPADPQTVAADTQTVAAETETPASAEPSVPASSTPPVTDVTDVLDAKRRGPLPALAAGTVGVLAAAAAAVFWWRRQQQIPPTRKEQLAARARAASLALATTKDQVTTSAAPLLRTGRKLSATAAQQAAVQARAAAELAAVQARTAAQQAAAVTAAARTVKLQRVPRDAAPQPVEPPTTGGHGHSKVVDALQALGGFAAGYALHARAGSGRTEHSGQPTSPQYRQFQQIAGRVQSRVTDTVRAGNAQLSQRAGGVADRVRRRPGSAGEVTWGSDDSDGPA